MRIASAHKNARNMAQIILITYSGLVNRAVSDGYWHWAAALNA